MNSDGCSGIEASSDFKSNVLYSSQYLYFHFEEILRGAFNLGEKSTIQKSFDRFSILKSWNNITNRESGGCGTTLA